jgi:hypothetical protein
MKVKSLHYLFSKKDKWGSKLISWASSKMVEMDDYPAHVALLINDRWVFESTYKNNVSIMTYNKWLELNHETHKIQCNKEREYNEIKDLFRRLEGKKYDWGGIIYFAYRFILYYLFSIKLPVMNKLQSKEKYFCCEVIGELNDISYDMSLPSQVYLDLLEILKYK